MHVGIVDPLAVGVVHDGSAGVEHLDLLLGKLAVQDVEVGAALRNTYIRSCLFLMYKLLFQRRALPQKLFALFLGEVNT